MNILHLNYKLFLAALNFILINSESAMIDMFKDVQPNEIDVENADYDKWSHGVKDKCEIKIITHGVCSVNSQIIKPQIYVKNLYYNKKRSCEQFLNGLIIIQLEIILIFLILIIDNKKLINNDRLRNMKHFNIGEAKANNLVDQFLIYFKDHFGAKIDPLILPEMGMFRFKEWGKQFFKIKCFIENTNK